jgi:hypothetical protein
VFLGINPVIIHINSLCKRKTLLICLVLPQKIDHSVHHKWVEKCRIYNSTFFCIAIILHASNCILHTAFILYGKLNVHFPNHVFVSFCPKEFKVYFFLCQCTLIKNLEKCIILIMCTDIHCFGF